jgi:predicted MFS family arabinose efflux permease
MRSGRMLFAALVYATLTSAIVSSLGMLLVPTIADEMSVSTSTAQWTLTINLLVGAIATPLAGRAVDGPRQRAVLIGILTVVIAGSIVAAVADDFGVFLVGRGLQGFVYAVPSITMAIARRHLPPDFVKQRLPVLAITVSLGLGLGYPITGALASVSGHALAFWFAAVFTVTTTVVAFVFVPRSPAAVPSERRRFDILGAILLSFGLGGLLLAVSEGSNWGETIIAALAAGSVLAFGGWIAVELRVRRPLVDLRLFRHSDVLVADATAIALGVTSFMLLSLSSLITQAPQSSGFGAGLTPVLAGTFILPYSVGSLFTTLTIRRLAARFGMETLLPVSSVVLTVSAVTMWLGHRQGPLLLLAMLLLGVSVSAMLAAMPSLIVERVPASEVGSAVGMNQVIRMVGSAVGSALTAALLGLQLTAGGRATSGGIALALSVTAAICLAMTIALVVRSLAVARRGAEQAGPLPDLPV